MNEITNGLKLPSGARFEDGEIAKQLKGELPAGSVASFIAPKTPESFADPGKLMTLENRTIGQVLAEWHSQARAHGERVERESRGMRYDPVTGVYY